MQRKRPACPIIYAGAHRKLPYRRCVMQENYEHYISRTIKKLYRKRLAAPVLYLIFTAILFGTLPISSVLFPSSLKRLSNLDSFFHKNDRFVSVSLENLHFTGYTRTRFHRTSGYFYYAYNPDQNECCIVLLSPSKIGRASCRERV